MKKLFTLFILATAFILSNAQAPQGINYQAVARNASGSVLATQGIGVRISIIDGSPTGTVQYTETHTVTTNQFGLFNSVIGNGTPISGTFAGITWNSGPKYIKVEIDPTGGTAYVDMGTTKFQSVPYALSSPPPPPNLNGTNNYIIKFSGNNNGISSAVYDSAGRVGIGNTKPAGALDVSGNIYTTANNSSDTSHSIFNRDSSRIGQASGAEFVGIELKVEPYLCGNGGIIKFLTWGCNVATNREVMRINELGNVGIGTSAPTAKLEVVGAFLASGTQTTHIQGAYLEWNKDNSTGRTYLLNQKGLGSGGFIIGEVSNTNVITERINIDGAGNVGIGTAPNDRLDVLAPGGKNVIIGGGGNTGSEIKFIFGGVAHYSIYNKGNGLLTFANTSAVTGSNTLGSTMMTISGAGDMVISGAATKPGGGSWTATSDFRLKENVQVYKDGLSQLMQINPVTFHYNGLSGLDTKPQYVGVIAQDLKEVAPYMVGTFTKDGTQYYNVDNSAMTYMLINAVKEQQAQIENQRIQIEALKKMIENLKPVVVKEEAK